MHFPFHKECVRPVSAASPAVRLAGARRSSTGGETAGMRRPCQNGATHDTSAAAGAGRNVPGLGQQGERSIRTLIVDDDAIFRKLLTRFLERWPQVELLGVAVDGLEALAIVAARRPHLVLVDLDLPGINGLQFTALICKFHPATRVIIVTNKDSEEVRATCLARGAEGFVSKSSLHLSLPRAINAVLPELVHGSRAKGAR